MEERFRLLTHVEHCYNTDLRLTFHQNLSPSFMASGINFYSQLGISLIRISDITNCDITKS